MLVADEGPLLSCPVAKDDAVFAVLHLDRIRNGGERKAAVGRNDGEPLCPHVVEILPTVGLHYLPAVVGIVLVDAARGADGADAVVHGVIDGVGKRAGIHQRVGLLQGNLLSGRSRLADVDELVPRIVVGVGIPAVGGDVELSMLNSKYFDHYF